MWWFSRSWGWTALIMSQVIALVALQLAGCSLGLDFEAPPDGSDVENLFVDMDGQQDVADAIDSADGDSQDSFIDGLDGPARSSADWT